MAIQGTPLIADIDDLLIQGDRLSSKAAWDLRDEQSEVTAYENAIAGLTDRNDFSSDDLYALEASLRDRFGPRRDEHALTPQQTALIAEKFQLAPQAVEMLSKDLAIALNPAEAPFVLQVPRQVSINRASVKLKDVRAKILSACDLLTCALQTIESLDTRQAKDRDGAEKLNKLRQDHEDLIFLGEALHRKYSILADRPDCALDLTPENRRKISDERRKMVLSCIFEFWVAVGRPLTTTTDPTANNHRKGPLYDFVNSIVACVTDPSITLSGHTIFDDLKAYRASNALK